MDIILHTLFCFAQLTALPVAIATVIETFKSKHFDSDWAKWVRMVVTAIVYFSFIFAYIFETGRYFFWQ